MNGSGGSLRRDFSDTRMFQHVDGFFTYNLIITNLYIHYVNKY